MMCGTSENARVSSSMTFRWSGPRTPRCGTVSSWTRPLPVHETESDDDEDIERLLARQRFRDEEGFFRKPSHQMYEYDEDVGRIRTVPGSTRPRPRLATWSPYCQCTEPKLESLYGFAQQCVTCGMPPAPTGTPPGSPSPT